MDGVKLRNWQVSLAVFGDVRDRPETIRVTPGDPGNTALLRDHHTSVFQAQWKRAPENSAVSFNP